MSLERIIELKICKERLCLFFILLLAFGHLRYAGAQTETHLQDTLGLPIVSIAVEGNKTVPSDQILDVVSTKVGETVEEAMCREVREETGLEVQVERLVGVYSKPQKQEVVLTFRCRVIGGVLQAINLIQ